MRPFTDQCLCSDHRPQNHSSQAQEGSSGLFLLRKHSLIHRQHQNQSYPVVQEHRLGHIKLITRFSSAPLTIVNAAGGILNFIFDLLSQVVTSDKTCYSKNTRTERDCTNSMTLYTTEHYHRQNNFRMISVFWKLYFDLILVFSCPQAASCH